MAVCLVTGGAGFIGSHLVEALVARGHTVRVLDNFSTGSLAHLAQVRDRIEVITGDVTDYNVVREATEGVEVVFHQAAHSSVMQSVVDPLATHQAGATGTLHVLLAAREAQVRRVIYAASSTAYGDGSHLPKRESDALQPLSPYAVAKLAGEQYCAAFSQVYGMETVRLRYFNVFGPRQLPGGPYGAVIPAFVEALVAGRSPVIQGDGLQTRDFTYVDDLIQANLLAAEAPRVAGRVYNIASGRRTTLLELMALINAILGTRIKPIHTSTRPGDFRHGQGDISRAQAELGYCPCTDLEQGLRRYLEYYLEQMDNTDRLNGSICHAD
jgi:UDP-glucose 4-epimerase